MDYVTEDRPRLQLHLFPVPIGRNFFCTFANLTDGRRVVASCLPQPDIHRTSNRQVSFFSPTFFDISTNTAHTRALLE